jgi:RNA-binding protein 26
LVTLKMIEESSSPVLDADRIEVPSPKEENNSTNSEAATGTEDFEISDVDDDDRNHKHRRLDHNLMIIQRSNIQGTLSKKGAGFLALGNQKDFVPRRPGAGAHSRVPRENQYFRADTSSSAAVRPPRGRGQNGARAPWTQHDPHP